MLRSTLVLAVLGVLAACHYSPGTSVPAPLRRDGAYEYAVRNGATSIGGVFFVLSDTIMVEPRDGLCKYDTGFINTERMRFNCDGLADVEELAIVFDRKDPVRSSTWTGIVQKPRYRRECERYTTDSQGRQVCVSYRTVFEYVRTPVTNALAVMTRQASKVPPT